MAKMIKCPTCATAIEVPPQSSGQIVKCPGCGKGLKLVAKKPAGSPMSQSGTGMNLAVDTGFSDPPLLESNCAVCGKSTDPDRLIEDNGKLVCPDCIKGARSYVDRPAGGSELLDFKTPLPAPSKRASIISVTPAFLGACAAALLLIGSQIYLSLIAKPVGTEIARIANPDGEPQPKDAHPPGPTPDPETATQPVVTTAPVSQAPDAGVVPAPLPGTPSPTTAMAIATSTDLAVPPATQEVGSTLFPPDNSPPQVTDNPPPPAPVPVTPAPPPAVTSNDPLERGLERLTAKDYDAAVQQFQNAKSKYPILASERTALTANQKMAFEGLGAAYVGQGKPDLAKVQLNVAYMRGDKSRSIVLNRAIVALTARPPSFKDIGEAANDLKNYLDSKSSDEYAADLFGTLLNKAAMMPNAPRDKIEPFWTYLDHYTDQMADKNPGQLRWGVEWLPAEDVKAYRLGRGQQIQTTGLTQAARELEFARTRLTTAERSYEQAQQAKTRGESIDLQGAKNQLDAATAAVTKAQQTFDAASAGLKYKKPRWLEKFDPVLPEADAAAH